jgi:muramoyltetrapeptide carboxypeptidase
VGVCAPGGPAEPSRVEAGARRLEELGFRVRLGDAVGDRTAFTAGPVERRLADLASLLADPEVKGVFCVRGGAGAAWLLPHLPVDGLRARPKVFVGYSDMTFLHLAFGRAEVVSFHGPMVAHELASDEMEEVSFRAAVMGEGGPYASAPDDLLPLAGGEAEGRLLGGCLSILAAAAGTPWAFRPDPDGTILFLEDVYERPYRIDRMLFTLRHAGALDGVRGIVFGDMKGCYPAAPADYTLEEVVLQSLSGLDVPIAIGLSSGHTRPNITLPLGVRARLRCGEDARFEVLERSVSSG